MASTKKWKEQTGFMNNTDFTILRLDRTELGDNMYVTVSKSSRKAGSFSIIHCLKLILSGLLLPL